MSEEQSEAIRIVRAAGHLAQPLEGDYIKVMRMLTPDTPYHGPLAEWETIDLWWYEAWLDGQPVPPNWEGIE